MNLQRYYDKRAYKYERVYYREDSLRQDEQQIIATAVQDNLKGKNVLEVACGTGYWTEFLSHTAKHIVATDGSVEMLTVAKEKRYECPITFKVADAFHLPFKENCFDSGMANFWFSHIPKDQIRLFLNELHSVCKKGSLIFMVDNVYVENVGGTLIKKIDDKNTYKLRALDDGTQTEVLKNYYSKKQLSNLFPNIQELFYGKCFWIVVYKI